MKKQTSNEKKNVESKASETKCQDLRCPYHGKLRVHGRIFKGYVKKIVGKRAIIEFERLMYIKKYERYMKKRTRLHAHIPDCITVKINDLVQIRGCRPISKIIHFIIIKKLSKDKTETIK